MELKCYFSQTDVCILVYSKIPKESPKVNLRINSVVSGGCFNLNTYTFNIYIQVGQFKSHQVLIFPVPDCTAAFETKSIYSPAILH